MNLSDKYNLKAAYPELAARWHPTKNGDLTPDKVTPFSSKKVWWMCDNGHEWMTMVSVRSKGKGCYFCTKNK